MSGELTKDQIAAIQKWIGDKRKNADCPVCNQTNSLTIQGHLVAPPIFSDGTLSVGGAAYPNVLLVCGNCAYSQLFNAVQMGLTK